MLGRYPSQIVEERLFVGSQRHGEDEKMLSDLRISHIVNCTLRREADYKHALSADALRFVRIAVRDAADADIAAHFGRAFAFIDGALAAKEKGFRVLVHGRAGVSRASTIAVAYLMRKRRMRAVDAIAFVKERRSKVCPNEGFVRQLRAYQKELGISE